MLWGPRFPARRSSFSVYWVRVCWRWVLSFIWECLFYLYSRTMFSLGLDFCLTYMAVDTMYVLMTSRRHHHGFNSPFFSQPFKISLHFSSPPRPWELRCISSSPFLWGLKRASLGTLGILPWPWENAKRMLFSPFLMENFPVGSGGREVRFVYLTSIYWMSSMYQMLF